MNQHGIDRLAMRARPPGQPVMHQRWEDLLFLHWPVNLADLRPLVPDSLQIDTYEGQAWIGLTPFHLTNLHPVGLPGIPGLKSFHELNLRTYVLHNQIPGIWFFSLDVSKVLPAITARIFFMLPYYRARIQFVDAGERFSMSLRRMGLPEGEFRAAWTRGARLADPHPDSLAFFLVERYCAFVTNGGRVSRIDIYHHPWILEETQVRLHRSTMLASLGLPEPATAPLAHFSKSLDVELWPPRAADAPAYQTHETTQRAV